MPPPSVYEAISRRDFASDQLDFLVDGIRHDIRNGENIDQQVAVAAQWAAILTALS